MERTDLASACGTQRYSGEWGLTLVSAPLSERMNMKVIFYVFGSFLLTMIFMALGLLWFTKDPQAVVFVVIFLPVAALFWIPVGFFATSICWMGMSLVWPDRTGSRIWLSGFGAVSALVSLTTVLGIFAAMGGNSDLYEVLPFVALAVIVSGILMANWVFG